MRSVLFATATVLALCSVATAGDLESGLKVGESAGFFLVKDVTGPSADKSLCYRCQYGRSPVVNVFTRTLSDDFGALVKGLDNSVTKNADSANMKGFVVLLTDDPDKAEKDLKAFAKKHDIKMPLTYFDGVAGPKSYKIAKDADVTVNMWRGLKSRANHAFKKDELKKENVTTVVKDTSKLLK